MNISGTNEWGPYQGYAATVDEIAKNYEGNGQRQDEIARYIRFCYRQINLLEAALETAPYSSISGDGVSTTIDREKVLKELAFYRNEIKKFHNDAPAMTRIVF